MASPVRRTRPSPTGEKDYDVEEWFEFVSSRPAPPRTDAPARPPGRGAEGVVRGWRLPKPGREPTIRHELVARVRREIEAGTYDTPEKLDTALARLLERLD